MHRILVVESENEFYQEYLLRHFGSILPMEDLEFVQAPNITAALERLPEVWDCILMSSPLGSPVRVPETGSIFRDGGDLIAFRRELEKEPAPGHLYGEAIPASFIMGIASNQVANRGMVEAGADTSLLKIHVQQMAQEILERLKLSVGH
jgi:hypothetical protein